jgi:hypothetical protein
MRQRCDRKRAKKDKDRHVELPDRINMTFQTLNESSSRMCRLSHGVLLVTLAIAALGHLDCVMSDGAASTSSSTIQRNPTIISGSTSSIWFPSRGGDVSAAGAKLSKTPKIQHQRKALPRQKSNPTSKNQQQQQQQQHNHHHQKELMSASTAVANVLADLCPHGMLPIGTYAIEGTETPLILQISSTLTDSFVQHLEWLQQVVLGQFCLC